jgi:hypothetical protein
MIEDWEIAVSHSRAGTGGSALRTARRRQRGLRRRAAACGILETMRLEESKRLRRESHAWWDDRAFRVAARTIRKLEYHGSARTVRWGGVVLGTGHDVSPHHARWIHRPPIPNGREVRGAKRKMAQRRREAARSCCHAAPPGLAVGSRRPSLHSQGSNRHGDRLHADGERTLRPLHICTDEIDDVVTFLESFNARD